MRNDNEWNFVHRDLPLSDRDLFFGEDELAFETFDDTWTLALPPHAGLFDSLTQARKNGGAGPIPPGFTFLQRGKGDRLRKMWILNKFPGWQDT